MKKITLFAALLFLTVASFAQSASNVVVVRVYEVTLGNSSIIVSYGDGKDEITELEGSLKPKNWPDNAHKLQMVLAKLLKEGYAIVSSTASGESGIQITTYILARKE